MLNVTNILCPVDFFPASLRAAEYATAFARNYGAKLDLLHIFMPPELSGSDGAGERSISARVQKVASAAAAAGIVVETELREGNIAQEIQLAIDAHHADLLVMGTHGRHGFEKWFLGSTTEKILRKVTIPVLTIRGDERHEDLAPPAIRRILIAVDFSEGTPEELVYGFSIAQECQAQVTLLHVVDDLFGVDAGGHHFEDFIAANIRKKLEELIPVGVRDWCEVATHVGTGVPSDAILSFLKSKNIDLLVMNIHSKGGLERALLGSTAEHIVRGAPCPVLLVPPVTRHYPSHDLRRK